MGKKQPKQQEYTIQQIIDRKDQTTPKGKVTYYKVLWEGYPVQQATWQKASILVKSPAVKKDIENFNNKRKTIQKIKENLPHIKALNQNVQKQKEINQKKSSPKSTVGSRVKKIIQLDSKKNQKLTESRSKTNQKPYLSIEPTQSSKKASQKDNVVVSKILENMRKKTAQNRPEKTILTEEKIIQLGDKMKDKIKSMSRAKKNVKSPALQTTEQIIKSRLKKSTTLKPIIEQNQTQQAVPLPEAIYENQTVTSPKSSPQLKEPSLLTVSCVNRIIDHIIEEKSSIFEKIVEKPLDEKKSTINQNQSIKLQLADQLIENVSLKEKQSLVTTEQPNTHLQKDEFLIKGMMVCKNQYFYLVEENGKSDVLSRSVMLDKYPYELIVFYEKRINIKPAEINMMIL